MLLGVDIGTSAIKPGLLDESGRIVATCSVPHAVKEPHPGWAEMDPDAWWEGLKEGIGGACREAGCTPGDIQGISFSTLYPALVCVAASGKALRPAILYCDQRAVKQSDWLRQNLDPEKTLRITGNGTPTGTCVLTSILWVKENEPDIFERTRWLCHPNSLLAYRLTGEMAMDWVGSSLSGLFELNGGYRWSKWVCKGAGIPMEKLPPLMPPSGKVGEVTREAAEQTGLREGTPVAIGAGDTGCSVFGAGLLEPGQLCLTCGTTDNIGFIADRPEFDIRFANCAHMVKGRWVFIATMTNTGAALEWFKRNFFDGASYDEIFAEADKVPAGSGGLVFLPYLQGERSPIWDPFARGVFCGLRLTTGKREMFRAVLEGVAFAIRQNLEIIEGIQGAPVDEMLTMGGAAQNRIWNQIKASVTGRPIRPLDFGQTALLGAAMLGGIAAGIYRDARDAIARTRTFSADDLVAPRAGDRQTYDRLFKTYLNLYDALKPSFAALVKRH
ncbi:MAG: FGGY-family carbohydrate kinase [Planctomycetota bacterium]